MTQSAAESTVWLTQEAYDRLSAELENLKGPARAEIARRIADAREEGDLKENGGYHAAREEQSKAEARILQLEDMLGKAQVGETPDSDGVVEAGMQVTAKIKGEVKTFLLGAREVLPPGDDTTLVYSPQSPIGTAIVGLRAGDTTSFKTPSGESDVEIIDSKPYVG